MLNDRQRWPTHLCLNLQYESTRRWTEWASVPDAGTLYDFGWHSRWPLHLGKRLLKGMRKGWGSDYRPDAGYFTLLNLMPFEGYEQAVWALRVRSDSAVLDLFGLVEEDMRTNGILISGELEYLLRGRDRSLLDVLAQAEQWWNHLRGERLKSGRPLNSGTWESADEFQTALNTAVRELRAMERKVTQENVANILQCNDRLLRHWLTRYNIDWKVISKRL